MQGGSLSKLVVEYLAVDQLAAFESNSRSHSKHQIRQIAASIKAFGFTNPVLIDNSNIIIAGHGRVEAAKTPQQANVLTISLPPRR